LALTAVAILVVLRMIRFRDLVEVRLPDTGEAKRGVKTGPVRELRAEQDQVAVFWADGAVTRHAPGDVKVLKPGFITLFRQTHKALFFAMIVLTLVPYGLLAFRWWILLRGHGFQAPFGQIFFVTYAGVFFNTILPGSVGGDLTKAILASAGEERKAAVVGTVILDRLIGLAVMIVIGATCLTPFLGRFTDKRVAFMIYGLLGGLLLGYALYFHPGLRRGLGSVLPFERIRRELDSVFRSAREKKGLVARAAAISLLAQSTVILVIYGLAIAMHIPGVEWWAFFIFEPIIFILTAIPISVGGWGVQEYLYAYLFGTIGGMDPNQAIALSILYKLTLMLFSIPGGILFALGAARRREPPR
jgi:uncharacterized membrane protein YbhN (UPF0104 family)